MAAHMLSHVFAGFKSANEGICTLTASTTVGLERLSQQECEEKLSVKCLMARGRVFFDYPVDRIEEVFKLRSVDKISILLGDCTLRNCVGAGKQNRQSETSLSFGEEVRSVLKTVNWTKGLDLWKSIKRHQVSSRTSSLSSSNQELDSQHQKQAAPQNNEKIHFHVKCDCIYGFYTPGTAESVAQVVGQALQHHLKWVPDGGQGSLEVTMQVYENYMCVGIVLDNKRRRHGFEKSGDNETLRPSVAYNLLRLAGLVDGETICDLTTTGNCIQAEAHHSWPKAQVIRGDLNDSKHTSEDWPRGGVMSILQWDGKKLPLQDNCIDVVLTQVPFPRSPTETGARTEYLPLPEPDFNGVLSELARVTRRRTGRAVLLTYRQNTLAMALHDLSRLWRYSLPARGIRGLTIFSLVRTLGCFY